MSLMSNEIFEQPKAMSECYEYNKNTLKDIIVQIKDKNIKSAVFAARGTSDHAATYGKYILEIYNNFVVSLSAPSVITLYGGKPDMSGQLVIGLSQSGEAADVLAVLEKANNDGALTVAITNNLFSPIARTAKYHLYCNAGEEKSVAATKTFMTQIYLLAMLNTILCDDNYILSELLVLPDKIEKLLIPTDIKIKEIIAKFKNIDNCFILSRGINYPIAMEAALKIKETCYVKANAFPISDFHHGPFAMVDSHSSVIMYLPDGPIIADSIEMIDKLNSMKADITIITSNDELLKKYSKTIAIPKTGGLDIISAFYCTMTAQLFALNLCETKNLNPDNPRGLKKITITK